VLLQYRVHANQISAQKESLLQEKINQIRENIIKYYLPSADMPTVAFLKELWNFKNGSKISFQIVRNISRLSEAFTIKHGVEKRIWKRAISNWVYDDFLITKNYDFGVGIYFLFSRPFYLFTKKKGDLLRIIFRSFKIKN
jgi:hypothetical protein